MCINAQNSLHRLHAVKDQHVLSEHDFLFSFSSLLNAFIAHFIYVTVL